MKVAFTICSNNYLAQAKTLADSIAKYSPEYKFYICLVDELDNRIDYKQFLPTEIILAKDLPLNFNDLKKKYSIIELNTCVKATCFKYLFHENPTTSHIHFFDPDIEIFNDLSYLDTYFENASFLVTPHITKPIVWGNKEPNENLFLNHGLYNFGYVGLKNNSPSVFEMLDWWELRLLERGFMRLERGLFVDQLWGNYFPIFYPKETTVLFELGCNMGPWNLHERQLTFDGTTYLVNNKFPLIFYHFSSYKYTNPLSISNNYRYDFTTNPDLLTIYTSYKDKIVENNVALLSSIPCSYYKNRPVISFLREMIYYCELVIFKIKYILKPL
jgi:hypothetical protein